MTLPEVTAKLTADVDQFIRAWNRAAAAAQRAAAQIKAALASIGDVDVSGFAKFSEELEKVGRTARTAQQDLKRFSESSRDLDRFGQSARKAGDGMREFGQHSQTVGRGVSTLSRIVSALAGALGGGGGGGGGGLGAGGGGLIGGLNRTQIGLAIMAAKAAAVVAILPPIITAAMGVGAALQGMAVAGGVVIGGWRGIEQAGERLKASMGGLQKQLESVFRAELSQEFQKLGHAISSMDGPLKGIARAVSDVVKEFTGWFRSAKGMDEIRNLLGGVENMIKSMAPGAKALAQAFTAFGDAAAPVLDQIGKAISSIFINLNNVIQKAKESGQLTKAFQNGAKAIEAFGKILATVLDIFIQIAANKDGADAIDLFAKALQNAVPLIVMFFDHSMKIVKVLMQISYAASQVIPVMKQVGGAFKEAGAGVMEFMKAAGGDKNAQGDLMVKLAKGAKMAGDALKQFSVISKLAFDTVGKESKKGTDEANKNTKNFASELGKNIKKGVDEAIKNIKKFGDSAKQEFAQGILNLVATAKKGMDDLATAVKVGIDKAIQFLKELPQKAMAALSQAVQQFKQAGKNMAEGLVEGFEQAAKNLVQAAMKAASAALNAIKGMLGIKSPSTVFRDEVGAMIPEGIAAGIIGNAGRVTDAMRRTGLGALAAGRPGAFGAAAARGGGQQVFTIQVQAGADSAMGTAIARLAQQGKLKITANAVVGGRR